MHVNGFKFRAAGEDNHMSFAQGKSNAIKKTLEKHLVKLHDKVGDAGVGSVLLHKGHNNNKDEIDVNDADNSKTKS